MQRLMALLRYVDGDYNDDATFTELRKQLGEAQRPLHYLAVPPSLFATVAQALAQVGLRRPRPSGDREAVRPQPRNCAQH